MGVTVLDDDSDRRRAPHDGTYRIGDSVFVMRTGDPIPDDAEIVEIETAPDERALPEAPENRALGKAPQNRSRRKPAKKDD